MIQKSQYTQGGRCLILPHKYSIPYGNRSIIACLPATSPPSPSTVIEVHVQVATHSVPHPSIKYFWISV